jgi:uncharacterized protein YjiS (DUF1127 family)
MSLPSVIGRVPEHSTGGRRHAAVLGAVGSFVCWLAEAVAREYRLRRDMRRLEGLSDFLLSDIGLSRGAIEGAVRYGRPPRRSERPSPTPGHVLPPATTPLTNRGEGQGVS